MIHRLSPCKINLLLNILGKREDGFHALETIMFPLPLADELSFERIETADVRLSIDGAKLSAGPDNLIIRAIEAFFGRTGAPFGVSVHLKKRIPMEAGLGGGSSNAAHTLQALNALANHPLEDRELHDIAGSLGSDVPFFLQSGPAYADGRGEKVRSLAPFASMQGKGLLLVKPGFGVSTVWAYQNLQRFPDLLNGKADRGKTLIQALGQSDFKQAAPLFFNSLEGPVLEKYPLLGLFQKSLQDLGAEATLMSGSGSTTFAVFASPAAAHAAIPCFVESYGDAHWIEALALP